MSSSYIARTGSTPAAMDTSDDADRFKAVLIVFEAVDILLVVVNVWLLSCMIAYGVKTKRWSRKGRSSRLDRGTIYLACLFAVASSLPRLFLTEVVFHVPLLGDEEHLCELLIDIGNVAYYVTSFSIYFFLWLRQRTIYSHPSSHSFAGKWTNAASYAFLFALSAISIVVTSFYVAPVTFMRASYGCIIDANARSDATADYLSAGALVLCQISLLALFVYPLVKSGAVVDKHETRTSTSGVVSPQRHPRSPKYRSHGSSRHGRFSSSVRSVLRGTKAARVARLIRRSLISAIVAVVADLVTMLAVTIIMPPYFPLSLAMTVYNISNLIKQLCILSTFNFYRKILMVFCGSVSTDATVRTSSTSTDAGNGRPKPEASSVSLPEVFSN